MRIFIARAAGGENMTGLPMRSPMLQLFVRWAVLAVGVTLAAELVPGIRCDDAQALIVVVLLLSFFNAILKPLLVLFTLPFILLTMGLGMIVINALLFLFVGRLVEGFYVAGFGSALGGALIVSVTNLILNGLFRDGGGRPPRNGPTPPPATRLKGDDVIDI
jgi:putative membrane protein